MISAVLFINLKGDLIIHRYYRDDVSRTVLDAFRHRIIAAKKTNTPVVDIDMCSFLYTRIGDVYVSAVTRKNANPTLIFQFIFKMCDAFRAYFGGTFDEEHVRNNFVLIYELMDEMMDHGYPQITAVNLLSTYIKVADVKDVKEVDSKPSSQITTELTGAVDWRQAGKYKYRKNEVFIDILEAVNLLMSNKGQVLKADVSGKVVMKSYLSGMPECKFGMNDKLVMEGEAKTRSSSRHSSGIAIDDVTFHRCVRLGQFDQDRSISFVPPDGEFELMKYRITQNVNLPFRVIPVVDEKSKTRIEYEIKVKGNFSSKLSATNVVIKIPTPKNTAKCHISQSIGKAKYSPEQNAMIWKLKKFAGDASYLLTATVKLLAAMEEKSWSRPPIVLEFQVPMFTASGLHVRYLKVLERTNYHTVKWVRYITRAGQYQIRI